MTPINLANFVECAEGEQKQATVVTFYGVPFPVKNDVYPRAYVFKNRDVDFVWADTKGIRFQPSSFETHGIKFYKPLPPKRLELQCHFTSAYLCFLDESTISININLFKDWNHTLKELKSFAGKKIKITIETDEL